MSKFVVVSKMPEQISKGDVVITPPDFAEQVHTAILRGGAHRDTTALNQLREILSAIQSRYEIDLNIYKIPLSLYEGIPYDSEAGLSRIVVQLLKTERPEAFEKILEYNIKTRPYGTKLIYYVGQHQDTGPFFKNGIDMIEEKDLDEFLGRKPKKVVGKPAVSKEQAAALAAEEKA